MSLTGHRAPGDVILPPLDVLAPFTTDLTFTVLCTLYFIGTCALLYFAGKKLWDADTKAINAHDSATAAAARKETATMGQASSASASAASAAPSAAAAAGEAKMMMALFVRQDLKMGTGKSAAQCAHASVAAVEQCMEDRGGIGWAAYLEHWRAGGSTTTVFKAPTEAELNAVIAEARKQRLPCYLVRDAGRTQIAAGSKTVTCVGPAPEEAVMAIAAGFNKL